MRKTRNHLRPNFKIKKIEINFFSKYSDTSHALSPFTRKGPIGGHSPSSYIFPWLLPQTSKAQTIVCILALMTVVDAWVPGFYRGGPWETAHATFYGGNDASGTMGTKSKL